MGHLQKTSSIWVGMVSELRESSCMDYEQPNEMCEEEFLQKDYVTSGLNQT